MHIWLVAIYLCTSGSSPSLCAHRARRHLSVHLWLVAASLCTSGSSPSLSAHLPRGRLSVHLGVRLIVSHIYIVRRSYNRSSASMASDRQTAQDRQELLWSIVRLGDVGQTDSSGPPQVYPALRRSGSWPVAFFLSSVGLSVRLSGVDRQLRTRLAGQLHLYSQPSP